MKKLIAIILSLVAVLCFLSKQVFDYVITQEAYSLVVFPYTLYSVIVVPIIYMGGMVAFLLFLEPSIELNHSNILNTKVLIYFSFGFVFLYVIAIIAFALTFSNIGYPIWCWNVLQWLCKNPIVFSFVGVLLFFGISTPTGSKSTE